MSETSPHHRSRPQRWRRALVPVVMGGAALVFAGTAFLLRAERVVTAGNIEVLAQLDEYTRTIDPGVADTIPGFLELPGTLASLTTLEPIDETELRKGFCTASVPKLVRQQYPGTYDTLSDAELEARVLETHPEYRDRVCALPAWVPPANEIVKYEMTPQSALQTTRGGLVWASIAAILFTVGALALHDRLLAAHDD